MPINLTHYVINDRQVLLMFPKKSAENKERFIRCGECANFKAYCFDALETGFT
jgi:hypothetical protein